MLNGAIEDLNRVGYVLQQENEGYDQQGSRVVTKVLFCERNQLQVVIQTTKKTLAVEHEALQEATTSLQEEVFTVDIAVNEGINKPTGEE
jgi:hypothetical protein